MSELTGAEVTRGNGFVGFPGALALRAADRAQLRLQAITRSCLILYLENLGLHRRLCPTDTCGFSKETLLPCGGFDSQEPGVF